MKIRTSKKLKIGALQRKLLILLAGGLSIGLSHNQRNQFRVLKQMGREWEKANRYYLKKSIASLYENKLVDYKEAADGLMTVVLNENGRKKALTYKLDEMKIMIPKKWDNKWRIIIFDVPQKLKKAREALRFHLKHLGFHQLQRSVFVIPYPCKEEMEFIIELHGLRPYVRQILADDIDNSFHLKKIFKF